MSWEDQAGKTECGKDGMQSPIDIGIGAARLDSGLETLSFDNGGGLPVTLVSNLYTWKIVWLTDKQKVNATSKAPAVFFKGNTYYLRQLLFHSPSEHTVDGMFSPMEAHLVHKTANGKKVLVIAVMLNLGAANSFFSMAWPQFPTNVTTSQQTTLPAPYDQMLPIDRSYWYYVGSLTTPPCQTGIQWIVMRQPAAMSEGQLSAFRAGITAISQNRLLVQMGTSTFPGVSAPWNEQMGVNNRPVQVLGPRVVSASPAIARTSWVPMALVGLLALSGLLVLCAVAWSLNCFGGSERRKTSSQSKTRGVELPQPQLVLPVPLMAQAQNLRVAVNGGAKYQLVPQAPPAQELPRFVQQAPPPSVVSVAAAPPRSSPVPSWSPAEPPPRTWTPAPEMEPLRNGEDEGLRGMKAYAG